MALIGTGYKRSLELKIIMAGSTPQSTISVTHNGSLAFGDTDGLTTSLGELSSGDFDTRKLAFMDYIKAYYLTSEPGLYDTIQWNQTRIEIPTEKGNINISFYCIPDLTFTTVKMVSDLPVTTGITQIVNYTDNDKGADRSPIFSIPVGSTSSMSFSIRNNSTINSIISNEVNFDASYIYSYNNDTLLLGPQDPSV